MPNPADWTTMAGAAAMLGVDQRSVRRMIDAGKLHAYTFYRSDSRFLWVPEVVELAAARQRVRGEKLCA